jgi:Transglutaminase-like superfamily
MIKNMRRMEPGEERYVRPPRSYELPEYRQGMKYCRSKEPYCRVARWCNYREPEVVALADELGAHELSDWEYAEAAYWWMKTHMWYELSDFYGPGKTLRIGAGACLHYNNTYIALCRCAGIKARFKSYKMKFRRLEREVFTDVDPQFASVFDASGGVIQEAETEVLIDGHWVVAYVPQTAMLTAASGWPISEFGESSLGTYFDALPGSIQRFENLSLAQGIGAKLMTKVAPATMERLNARMARVQILGRQELEDAGGIEGYNQIAQKKREFYSPDQILDQQAIKHYDKIIINQPKKPE